MITIEMINGKAYTVVWNNEHDAQASGETPLDFNGNDEFIALRNGVLLLHQMSEPFATALPSLPRHPKPEDARLLHLYAAEGIRIWMKSKYNKDGWAFSVHSIDIVHGLTEITHATINGERVDVAIEGEGYDQRRIDTEAS